MQVDVVTLPLGAELDCYILDAEIATGKTKTRPAVIICPGGGYLKTAAREREVVAVRFLGMGFHVFVLRYHTYVVEDDSASAPSVPGELPAVDPSSHYPIQLVDLMQAMAYVRAHAGSWHLDAKLIYALGFSAGGHIVGSLAERFDDAELLAWAGTKAGVATPRGVLLCYPMVNGNFVRDAIERERQGRPGSLPASFVARAVFGTDRPIAEDYDHINLAYHVRPDMPRMFVWQTAADGTLCASDTVAFVECAMRAGATCEFHLFQRGPHGMSLCDDTSASKPEDIDGAAMAWVDLAHTWLTLDMQDAKQGC